MGAEVAVFWPYESLRDRCRAEIYTLNSGEICSLPNRMETSFYASEGYRSVQAMEKSGFEIENLGNFAEVTWPGILTRRFVSDPSYGIPYLTTSGMMEAKPKATVYLSIKNTPKINEYIVSENTILISRSGSIGNIALVSKDLDGWAISEDALRVRLFDQVDLGLIYCYLQSPPGQFLLKRSQSGSVVTHIYEQDVAPLPIPKLPLRLREELTRQVKKAADLRVEANVLLDEAEEAVNRLYHINEAALGTNNQLEFRSINSGRLITQYEYKDHIRLEANFQNSLATMAEELIKNSKCWRTLGSLVKSIPYTGPGSLPGVNKVDPEFGIPAITGKDLKNTKPKPAYYLGSPKKHLLESMIPKTGTILMMCAGKLAEIDYVNGVYEGWAVSLDVIRVIPDNKKLHQGYLYAFLSTLLAKNQILKHKYGSVIPRIHSRQVREILVPIPGDNGLEIGSIVDKAFRKRSKALELENNAIDLFLKGIMTGRGTTEEIWGKEY